jgi:hypothetical protein
MPSAEGQEQHDDGNAADSSSGAPDDIKARMREALARKKGHDTGVAHPADSKEKAHGAEVRGGAGPKVHRRKAGGGGS